MDTHLEKTESGVFILAVSGEVDKNSSPDLRDLLVPLFSEYPKALLIDLSEVTYMDSSGMATLAEGLQLSHRQEMPFRIFGLTDAVKVVFELARLESMFDIFGSREAALEGLP
jgi:anti-sigma B factor antagonist